MIMIMKKYKHILNTPLLSCIFLLFAFCADDSRQPDDCFDCAKTAYEYFADISKIPRCSGNEGAASDYLAAFGRSLGLETYQDGARNVLIKKRGSAGREGDPPVVLQAHMDMVCVKDEDDGHDFESDPIIPVTVDGDWVTARGRTTLGADNGSGVSMIMAALANSFSHPPIEAVMTTEEETGMVGAGRFDVSRLNGRRLINLDMVEEKVFAVSSTGTTYTEMRIPVEDVVLPDGLASYRLSVTAAWDAIILVARILNELDSAGIYVSGIDGDPYDCSAVISFDGDDFGIVQSAVSRTEAEFKPQFPAGTTELSITIGETAAPQSAMNGGSARRVLSGILQMPNGMQDMNPLFEGVVQTYIDFRAIVTGGGAATISNVARGSSPAKLDELLDRVNTLAEATGASLEITQYYPGWQYAAHSPLRDKMADVFRDFYGEEPVIKGIRAGVECAVFATKMPDADMISIGPDIVDIHTPDERMSISSYGRVYDFLVRVLGELRD